MVEQHPTHGSLDFALIIALLKQYWHNAMFRVLASGKQNRSNVHWLNKSDDILTRQKKANIPCPRQRGCSSRHSRLRRVAAVEICSERREEKLG
jgi:hypothetical protein